MTIDVGIIMGSRSDWETMRHATETLDELGVAYQTLVGLLLRQQLRDVDAGLVPGNHIARSALSRRERRLLVDTLRAVRRFRSRLRTELTGELY